ncbi:hypothetical protein LAZ67_20001814 [Cordylochernes scorpioides]|uniref:Integrase p58-like C-terminal domain-containing protein n=1 Tax=Cordylochernes scorpioides TaxID=51811 RepID=A0ABY6LKI0_9ARAC|nr:hypothetical protein LAZ67_20001814 [Cordylochernes scorpioides]
MLARLSILQAQSKDKERYDKKHQDVTYKEGDLVWVFTPVRTVGLSEKLLKRYFGPYRVIRKISSVNYQVEGLTNTRRRRKTQDIVHVVRMKPYHDPEVQEHIAQERMKKYYNKYYYDFKYNIGDLIAIWTPIRKIRRYEKLPISNFGPYIISGKVSELNYLVTPKDEPNIDQYDVHISRMKP